MQWREFRREGRDNTLVWRIAQDGDNYFTEHGVIQGALQKFSDTPGSKGKDGTKAYVSAKDNCAFHISREIRKKEEHGYIEFKGGNPVKETITELKFDSYLPKNFCGYKPQTNIANNILTKIHNADKARYTRKYDGQCHLIVHHTWGWEIYTRRMDIATDRFPNHIEELNDSDLEVGTIIMAEAVCFKSNGREDFKLISRFCRSDPAEARKLVVSEEVPEPRLVIFDMLWRNGKDLKDTKYDHRAVVWKDCLDQVIPNHKLIQSVDYFNVTPDNWEETAKKNGWEGFVITDGDSVPGNKFYSFDGDAKRPKGHYKLKPYWTEDVVVYAGVKGSGKRLDTVGAVFIKQKYPKFYPGTKDPHPNAGEWFSCGKVGSGFEDSDLTDIERLLKKNKLSILEDDKEVKNLILDNSGITIEIEFGERQPGSQKFRFPVFMRVREDKAAHECFAQRLAPDDEDDS